MPTSQPGETERERTMHIAVLRERFEGERRVALIPSHLPTLAEAGVQVRIEAGAGAAAGWTDEAYRAAGAQVEEDRRRLLEGARAVLRVRPPDPDELDDLPAGILLISFLGPSTHDLPTELAGRRVDALALERVPRTTRAQRMDALSSQATVAGYRAVLLAADLLPRFLPMLTTAAGTIRPARFLVMGAGVSGLQAIATARRLGARVQGYDIRTAAAEQVRSLGATFLEDELPEEAEGEGGYARQLSETEEERQLRFLGTHVPGVDVVITTAQIPGRPAPTLVTRRMVEGMAPGSVVVDVAAETGGNCELSEPGRTIVHGGVTVAAPLNLPSGAAQHASEMFGRNVIALLEHLLHEGDLSLSTDDEIVDAILVVRNGRARSRGDTDNGNGE
jgi:H+-translocating NAD(P) transhydrogenase subunit alpha